MWDGDWQDIGTPSGELGTREGNLLPNQRLSTKCCGKVVQAFGELPLPSLERDRRSSGIISAIGAPPSPLGCRLGGQC